MSENNSLSSHHHIQSDVPIDNPKDDAYGYASFAKNIAISIRDIPTPNGFVIAIHGSWGDGKSSVLNLVKRDLDKNSEKDNKPIIIDFDPWWFDDRTHLAGQFFTQFKNNLPGPLRGKMSKYAHAIEGSKSFMGDIMEDIVELVSDVPLLGKVSRPIFQKLFKWKRPVDILQRKEYISTLLNDSKKRFVFFIDDIDRLTPNEIIDVFKVVKALADFPNVIYVMAFDKSIVTKAINECLKINGDQYLEKIVQISLDVPRCNHKKLTDSLLNDLRNFIAYFNPPLLFDDGDFRRLFDQGMRNYFMKPRDVNRYMNTLMVSFTSGRYNVNTTDFFALEFLRLFFPKLYEFIRDNPRHFCLPKAKPLNEGSWDSKLINEIMGTIPPHYHHDLWCILKIIFPLTNNLLVNNSFSESDWEKILKKHSVAKNVTHPEVFPSYFQLDVEPNSTPP